MILKVKFWSKRFIWLSIFDCEPRTECRLFLQQLWDETLYFIRFRKRSCRATHKSMHHKERFYERRSRCRAYSVERYALNSRLWSSSWLSFSPLSLPRTPALSVCVFYLLKLRSLLVIFIKQARLINFEAIYPWYICLSRFWRDHVLKKKV